MKNAFSLLEILFCLLIIAITSTIALKPHINELIAIREASAHLQILQKNLNDIVYTAYLQKSSIDNPAIQALLATSQAQNRFFTLKLDSSNNFTLTLSNKKRLKLALRQNSNGSFSITCNPNQELCRKLYHSK